MGSGKWSFISWSRKELPSSFLVYEGLKVKPLKKKFNMLKYTEFHNEESLFKTYVARVRIGIRVRVWDLTILKKVGASAAGLGD